MNNDADKKFYASYGFEESGEALEVVRKSAEEGEEGVKGQFVSMAAREGVIRALVNERRAGLMDGVGKWTRWRKGCEHLRTLRAEELAARKRGKRENKPEEVLEEISQEQESLEEALKKLDKLKGEMLKLEFLKETSEEVISRRKFKEQRLKEKLKEYTTRKEISEKKILKLEILMESFSLLKDIPRNKLQADNARMSFSLMEGIPQNEQPGKMETRSLFRDISCRTSPSISFPSFELDCTTRWTAERGNIAETDDIVETIENQESHEDDRETR
ncbi:hypothetical protein SMACR_06844 [Sordaria macrospora]|uniref:WGS project CABT00000000 data, contig 2.6 n=2 Tax=Sordaria macrospora TaxID=5147 RepID=F7VSL6_SORMK|nr:uncharacterized protein SMAC_06844 [Sordaria macrospora k-hell]KAA8630198.1 hypothetical protein SMACR_06844 [Sordaria macrospora]WPJ57690.1 hypothetical protein SMAC4_06844 [Sordaria macrospora]CCC08683.1 unnamed protein product [Sordaria macrospora k-hell]